MKLKCFKYVYIWGKFLNLIASYARDYQDEQQMQLLLIKLQQYEYMPSSPID